MTFTRLADMGGRSSRLSWLLCGVAVVAMVVKALANGSGVFDIQFADETLYMDAGLHGPDLRKHEWSGLYSLYYRALSQVLDDPVSLYLWGGVLLVGACVLAIFLSISVISRSPLAGLVAAALFILGDLLTIWPRVSYAAIVVLCAGMTAFVLAKPALAKAAILLLSAFLVSFIRPEFVVSFYILIAVTAAALLWEIVSAARAGRIRDLLRPAMAPAWAALFALAVLMSAWTFPAFSSGARAFIAFGQHFAVRHVESNKLTINPWWNYQKIAEQFFPGATSVADAARIAPGTFAQFMLANGAGLATQLRRDIGRAVWPRPLGGNIARVAGWALVVVGVILLVRSTARGATGGALPEPDAGYRDRLMIIAGALVLALPPLISAIVIFPRRHYVVMILYLLLVCGAAMIRRMPRPDPPSMAVAAIAAGLVVLTPVLPKADAQELRAIHALRAVPGIKVLFEGDLGWCVYYRPRCTPVYPEESMEAMLAKHNVDAVLVSPSLLAAEWNANDPFVKQLMADPGRFGFERIILTDSRMLLVKR
jgi:hypothetical protein